MTKRIARVGDRADNLSPEILPIFFINEEPMKNLKYAFYFLKHYLAVLFFGIKFGINPLTLLLHDWTKLRPEEWVPYREFFYGEKTDEVVKNFLDAVNVHVHRNKHHPEHWVVYKEGRYCREMHHDYFMEMMADWFAANWAMNSEYDVKGWYLEMGWEKLFHPDTRKKIHEFLGITDEEYYLANGEGKIRNEILEWMEEGLRSSKPGKREMRNENDEYCIIGAIDLGGAIANGEEYRTFYMPPKHRQQLTTLYPVKNLPPYIRVEMLKTVPTMSADGHMPINTILIFVNDMYDRETAAAVARNILS